MNSFELSIVNPEKTVYHGKVVSLIAPSESGYLGVMAGHDSMVANLVSGKIIVKEETDSQRIFNSQGKGTLEVLHNKVTILLHHSLSLS